MNTNCKKIGRTVQVHVEVRVEVQAAESVLRSKSRVSRQKLIKREAPNRRFARALRTVGALPLYLIRVDFRSRDFDRLKSLHSANVLESHYPVAEHHSGPSIGTGIFGGVCIGR